jgi:hypothetical protein
LLNFLHHLVEKPVDTFNKIKEEILNEFDNFDFSAPYEIGKII